MLVLGRKRNQEILIGDNIKVVVLDMTQSTVKIGIVAPKEVRVLRTEIINRPERPKTAAEQTEPAAAPTAKAVRNHTASRAVDPFELNVHGADATAGGVNLAPVRESSVKLGSMADRVRQLRSATEVRIHPRLSAAV